MKKIALEIKDLKVAHSRMDENVNEWVGRFLYKTNRTDLILKNINLSVYEDEILGLVGESGCGKSVTVKSIFGMVNFSPGILSGEINYFNQEGNKVSLLDYPDAQNHLENKTYGESVKYNELKHTFDSKQSSDDEILQEWIYNENLDFTDKDSLETDSDINRFKVLNREHVFPGNLSEHIEANFKTQKNEGNVLAGKELSIILQDPLTFLNPHWSIRTQIRNLYNLFSPKQRKKSMPGVHEMAHLQKTQRILKDLRIDTSEFLDKLPGELSGGQAQRVMIVLSRMSNPHLLIADEPTTGLDVTLKKRVVDFFRERNNPMIFISHDLNMVSMVSDRINIMYYGEIVENCESKSFKPGLLHHPFTEKLVSVFYTDYSEYIDKELPSKQEMKNYHGCGYALQGCPHVTDICKKISPPAIDIEKKEFIKDNETEKHWAKCWKFMYEK